MGNPFADMEVVTFWEEVNHIEEVASRKEFQNGQEVHVWISQNNYDSSMFYSMLAPDEKVQACRFRYTKDRNRYIVSHGILRQHLSSYLNRDLTKLKVSISEYGKPFLAKSEMLFDMSHSADVTSIILSARNNVGIDIEELKGDFGWKCIARKYFTYKELCYLEELDLENQTKSFYNLWTQKEAILKAKGIGLYGIEKVKSRDYRSFLRKNSLASFNYKGNYQGTAAISSKPPSIRFFRFSAL